MPGQPFDQCRFTGAYRTGNAYFYILSFHALFIFCVHDIYSLEYNCSCCMLRMSKPGQHTPIISLSGCKLFCTNWVISGCNENNNSCPACWLNGISLTLLVTYPLAAL